MRPWQHALSSTKGNGEWLNDLPIHEFVDCTKVACPDVRHRMIMHNSDLGPELAARAFPDRPDARAIALGHVCEDFGKPLDLTQWIAVCDIEKFPRPQIDLSTLDDVAIGVARTQGIQDADHPRAVVELLTLPTQFAGPDAISLLFNAMGPMMVRTIIGAPRRVKGIDGNEVMFEPRHMAEKIIQAAYGRIPTLVDVVSAIREMPKMVKENA